MRAAPGSAIEKISCLAPPIGRFTNAINTVALTPPFFVGPIGTSDFANRAIRSRQRGLEWGADGRIFPVSLAPIPIANCHSGAHVAFVERPQEDATINRMELRSGRCPADRTSFSKISLASDRQCSI